MLRLGRYSGSSVKGYIPALADLRTRVFRDFPYLYEGDPAYETRYLQTYTDSPRSVVVLVFDGESVVGASTALPLTDETENVQVPFLEHGPLPSQVYYFGESVLLPAYRGQGLGVRFFEEREAQAREHGFAYASFCAVERPAEHPLRPADYVPLDNFWHKRGYEKQPDLRTTFSWQEIGEAHESPKPMVFWLKRL